MSVPGLISQVDFERNIYSEYYMGIGKESNEIKESIKIAVEHFFLPISRQMESPLFKFNQLKRQWEEESRFLSSISEIVMHPAYQSIIGMGKAAIPFIIRDLVESQNHWFWALKSITGEDPVPPSKRGKIKEMTVEWLRWWLRNQDNI